MKSKFKYNILPKLALLSATIIWGSSFIIVKDTTDSLPPNLLIAVRFTLGCIALSIIFFKKLKQLDKGYFLSGALIGFFLFCAYSAQTIGITDTTPGKNAFLTAVYCVLVPFLFCAVIRKKPAVKNILTALICFAGIGLVSLGEGFAIAKGDAFTLLGGVFYAAHIVAFAKVATNRDPFLLTILQFGYAAIFSWISTLLFEDMPTSVSFTTVISVGYLAIFCTAVALLFQSIGQKYVEPSSASLILSLESVFGVLFSIVFYNEPMTLRITAGFSLIFIAITANEISFSKLLGKRKK